MKKIAKIFLCLAVISLFLYSNNYNLFYSIVLANDEIEPSTAYNEEEILEGDLTKSDGKIAFWTNDEKTKADIVISYKQELNDGLYLATLCNAHNLTLEYLSNEITEATALSNIKLYLEGRDIFGYEFPNGGNVYQGANRITNQRAQINLSKGTTFNINEANIINQAEGPTQGKPIRFGQGVDVNNDENDSLLITSSGEHANVRAFAEDIIDALENKNLKVTELAKSSEEAWALEDDITLHPLYLEPPADASQLTQYDLALLMITNVLKEGTELLYAGDADVIRSAFSVDDLKGNHVFLPQVLSRKKQIVPSLSQLWG